MEKNIQKSQATSTAKQCKKKTIHVKGKSSDSKQKNKCAEHEHKNLDVYFIAWEEGGVHFLNNAEFVKSPANLRVHVFYSKGTSAQELPKSAKWIVGHESLTDSNEAIWVDLIAYVVSFYARAAVEYGCQLCRNNNKPKLNMNLICSDNDRGKELIAVMKANKVEIKVVDGRKHTFLDMFQHVCYPCKLIFESTSDANKHDKACHNFLCHNTQCERSRRGNGFYTREELEKHLRGQKFCKYCPSDVFCTESRFQNHMRDNHKQCPCPCGEYFERHDDLMEHFYARYPLPCLEEPACDARFRDIEAQAFHHKSVHGTNYPYYCMACFKKEKLVRLRTANELMNHVDEENHTENDFKFAIIPPALLEGKQ
eukprot:gene12018-13258_t